MNFPLRLAVAGLGCLTSLNLVAATVSINVSAGEHDRRETVVTFQVPVEARKFLPSPALVLHESTAVPLAWESDGRASFVVGEMAKGSSRSYRVVGLPSDNTGETNGSLGSRSPK